MVFPPHSKRAFITLSYDEEWQFSKLQIRCKVHSIFYLGLTYHIGSVQMISIQQTPTNSWSKALFLLMHSNFRDRGCTKILRTMHIQCGPSMMDSVDLYPSKPAIDITIDILFYSMMSMIDITLMMADRYPFYYMMQMIDITLIMADRYPFLLYDVDDRYHFDNV